MFGKKKFKVTSSKVDPAGKKTTITISTDDEKVVRKLLDSSKMESMDAEFKEAKRKLLEQIKRVLKLRQSQLKKQHSRLYLSLLKNQNLN